MSSSHAEAAAPRVAVVTGASAGIGAATVNALVDAGFRVVAGARRVDRLAAVCAPYGDAVEARALDVTDPASVVAFADARPDAVHVVVNNAGFARGLDTALGVGDDAWRAMYDTNVIGVVRVTRALLDRLLASGDGLIVNVGSIAGFETYPGGGGYTASKHALRALTRTLRLELLGAPVRITEIAPGMVETDFSVVRFDGDRDRADAVYRGMTPLTAHDIAACIRWVADLPPHVNIDELVVRPRDQATATRVHRQGD
ncbi:MAG: SDR family NAD(P)-dependent oxidoreductase [Acidobacteriota bacterium]